MFEPSGHLGRYRVQSTLGSGGMGIVYRAWDPQLERAIAIKVVKHASEAMRARLVREAQSLAKLSHTNVCHVYDVGTEDDEVWVAMELIDGKTLRAWCEGKGTQAITDVLVAAAEGLAAAHAAGIVHRDVKPENVLVANDGRAVVTDFGLARADDHVDAVGSTVSGDPNATVASVAQYATASGVIAGTPAYLAPEQLTGAPIDPRVDQFAWAVMAWELVTGLGPFPIVAGPRLDAIRAGIKPPPSMPPQLGAVLVRALSAAPRDRFPSMRELIDALAAPPAPPRDRWTRFVVASISALFLGGIVAGVIAASRDHAKQQVTTPEAPVETPSPATNDETPLSVDQFPPNKPGIMENIFETMCTIPVDPAAKGLDHNSDVDWGRITRRTTAIGESGGLRRDLLLYELKGARETYRFDGWISAIGALHADVGDLVVICPDGGGDSMFTVPAGWEHTTAVKGFIKVSAPPAITQFVHPAPTHIRSGTPGREATNHRLEGSTEGHYFLRAKALKNNDGRWEMEGGWFLDVPATASGASDMSTTRMWFVITAGHFEDDRLVYRADAVIAQMFPQ